MSAMLRIAKMPQRVRDTEAGLNKPARIAIVRTDPQPEI
jgi:hypothetical protein